MSSKITLFVLIGVFCVTFSCDPFDTNTTTVSIGPIAEVEPNDSLATATNLGVNIDKGMVITVTGTTDGAPDDYFTFGWGTATTINVVATWATGSDALDLIIYNTVGTVIALAASTFFDLETVLSPPGQVSMYVQVFSLVGGTSYTLTITGN